MLCQGRMRMKCKDEDKEGRQRRCMLYLSFVFTGGVTASSTGFLPTWLLCTHPAAAAQAQSRPQLCVRLLCGWLMVCFGSGSLHGLRSLPTASPAEPCLDKWQLLPAWNGVLLLTVLNFLQNWPVRGSRSSFLAHLSGSDSFCSGIIKRVVKLLLPIAATCAKNSQEEPLCLCDF